MGRSRNLCVGIPSVRDSESPCNHLKVYSMSMYNDFQRYIGSTRKIPCNLLFIQENLTDGGGAGLKSKGGSSRCTPVSRGYRRPESLDPDVMVDQRKGMTTNLLPSVGFTSTVEVYTHKGKEKKKET